MHLTHTSLLALALVFASSAAFAQTTGDPVAGKVVYENTAAATGNAGLMSCPACHSGIQDHRALIAARTGLDGGTYADISVETALTRFNEAVARTSTGMGQFLPLSDTHKRNVTAYLADTPKTTPASESLLTFNVAAINTSATAQTVTLRHGATATQNLQIVSVQVDGANETNFSTTTTCGTTLAAGAACTVALTYRPSNTNLSDPELVFTLREGGSGDFFRVLRLSGSVGSPPPADSGGGALGGAWLAALALATALLARQRR